ATLGFAELAGEIDGEAAVDGNLAAPFAHLAAHLRAGSWRGIPIDALTARAVVSLLALDVVELEGTVAGGAIAGAGHLLWDGGLVEAKLSASRLALARVPAAARFAAVGEVI